MRRHTRTAQYYTCWQTPTLAQVQVLLLALAAAAILCAPLTSAQCGPPLAIETRYLDSQCTCANRSYLLTMDPREASCENVQCQPWGALQYGAYSQVRCPLVGSVERLCPPPVLTVDRWSKGEVCTGTPSSGADLPLVVLDTCVTGVSAFGYGELSPSNGRWPSVIVTCDVAAGKATMQVFQDERCQLLDTRSQAQREIILGKCYVGMDLPDSPDSQRFTCRNDLPPLPSSTVQPGQDDRTANCVNAAGNYVNAAGSTAASVGAPWAASAATAVGLTAYHHGWSSCRGLGLFLHLVWPVLLVAAGTFASAIDLSA